MYQILSISPINDLHITLDYLVQNHVTLQINILELYETEKYYMILYMQTHKTYFQP